jgi:hypothetical protein
VKIRRAEDVAWRRIDRETVVVHLTRQRMFALNEAGGKLWDGLEAPPEGDRLTEILNNPAATAFLADLAAEGLVECDGPLPEAPPASPVGIGHIPPRIEWREDVRRFAGPCAFLPGQSLLCDTSPDRS